MPTGKDGNPKLGAARGSLAKIGTLDELQAAIWEVIAKLKAEVVEQGTLIDTLPLKACHTLATLGGVYARLHEINDLDTRLSEVEKRLNEEPKR